ncbi:MAG: hypothetical protein AcusKO_21780 [Acuticoccus sp.]
MRRFDLIVVAIVTGVLVASLFVISWSTVRSAEGVLLPALDRKAQSVAGSIAGLGTEAVGYGIPVDRLVGGEEVLRAALDENREFGFATILDAEGGIVAQAARGSAGGYDGADDSEYFVVSAPIGDAAAPAGEVLIGMPITVGEKLVRDLWIDVAVLLLVSVLVALELTSFAFTRPSALVLRGLAQRLEAVRRGDVRPHPTLTDSGPLGAELRTVDEEIARLRGEHQALRTEAETHRHEGVREALHRLGRTYRLTDARDLPPLALMAVRAPIFLFFFAEELTRSFLPTYIASHARPMLGLSVELVIALPIIVFMAVVAFMQPTLNGWTEQLGRRRSLCMGALLAGAGYLGTAYAGDMAQILLSRTITAFGFAAVFVSSQGFIVDRTDAAHRARGIGLFVSAIMAAMLCGPPIGGIVADRLGDSAALTLSAIMAFVACVCAFLALPADSTAAAVGAVRRTVRLGDIRRVLAQPLMVGLLVGCALPAKMILIGVCIYVLPLLLASQFEPAVIGRVLMLYGLAMLFVVPVVSRWSDAGSRRTAYVVAGGLLSALAIVHYFVWPQPWGAALMVLQIGIAQGISTTPQSALVGEIGRRILPDLSEGGIYGVFRLVERTGTALGPLFVGVVWTMTSAEVALFATAALVAIGALAFAALWWSAPAGLKPAVAVEAKQ